MKSPRPPKYKRSFESPITGKLSPEIPHLFQIYWSFDGSLACTSQDITKGFWQQETCAIFGQELESFNQKSDIIQSGVNTMQTTLFLN